MGRLGQAAFGLAGLAKIKTTGSLAVDIALDDLSIYLSVEPGMLPFQLP
jgi:hypothetical protein